MTRPLIASTENQLMDVLLRAPFGAAARPALSATRFGAAHGARASAPPVHPPIWSGTAPAYRGEPAWSTSTKTPAASLHYSMTNGRAADVLRLRSREVASARCPSARTASTRRARTKPCSWVCRRGYSIAACRKARRGLRRHDRARRCRERRNRRSCSIADRLLARPAAQQAASRPSRRLVNERPARFARVGSCHGACLVPRQDLNSGEVSSLLADDFARHARSRSLRARRPSPSRRNVPAVQRDRPARPRYGLCWGQTKKPTHPGAPASTLVEMRMPPNSRRSEARPAPLDHDRRRSCSRPVALRPEKKLGVSLCPNGSALRGCRKSSSSSFKTMPACSSTKPDPKELLTVVVSGHHAFPERSAVTRACVPCSSSAKRGILVGPIHRDRLTPSFEPIGVERRFSRDGSVIGISRGSGSDLPARPRRLGKIHADKPLS